MNTATPTPLVRHFLRRVRSHSGVSVLAIAILATMMCSCQSDRQARSSKSDVVVSEKTEVSATESLIELLRNPPRWPNDYAEPSSPGYAWLREIWAVAAEHSDEQLDRIIGELSQSEDGQMLPLPSFRRWSYLLFLRLLYDCDARMSPQGSVVSNYGHWMMLFLSDDEQASLDKTRWVRLLIVNDGDIEVMLPRTERGGLALSRGIFYSGFPYRFHDEAVRFAEEYNRRTRPEHPDEARRDADPLRTTLRTHPRRRPGPTEWRRPAHRAGVADPC